MMDRIKIGLSFFAAFIVGLGLAALLAITAHAPARAHGVAHWIEEQKLTDPVSGVWCCNLIDCREETSNVSPAVGGYLIQSTGEVIEAKRVIWRSPGGWWRCRNLTTNATRCLIGPPQGT